MNKTVASVIDDINEWVSPKGGIIHFVTCFFTDGDVGSVGKKDHDAALEIQGLLRESIGVLQDFTLEQKGETKSGKQKWNIKGFGTPGGAATYTAPSSPGTTAPGGHANKGERYSGRSPEHDQQKEDSIRAAVALKAAVRLLRPMQEKHETGEVSPQLVMAVADWMNEWLARTSEPASSAYKGGEPASTVVSQAGADSEDLPQETRPQPADGAGLVDSGDGEAPESTPHIHDYQLRQGVKGFLVCECGKTRKKETANTAPE